MKGGVVGRGEGSFEKIVVGVEMYLEEGKLVGRKVQLLKVVQRAKGSGGEEEQAIVLKNQHLQSGGGLERGL